ncbi:hypothetical protein JCM11251_007013 [Rhodosporidiobolus azoricus]
MPVRITFADEDVLASKPAADPSHGHPHPRISDDSSTIAPSPSVESLKRRRSATPRLSTLPTHSNKKPRVHVFDDEAEDDQAISRSEQGSGNGLLAMQNVVPDGRHRAVWSAEARKKAQQEAQRLLIGRKHLPVYEGKDEILKGVAESDTVIVLGETGSGKTTQIPQFLLHSSTPCPAPRVVCTQPRRVAAISLAARVAAEVGVQLGGLVGYTVRFDDNTSPRTRLKYATDGSLLAEMLSDRDLEAYDVVILDEAHERSLRTDMLMGFLKDIQKRRKEKVRAWKEERGMGGKSEVKGKGKAQEKSEERPPSELKIVVMSATIDAKGFSDFFDRAPVLFVKGRQHKVDLHYAAEPQTDYLDAALKTVFQIHAKYPPGAILVFLPGQDEIESLQSSILSYLPDLLKSSPGADEIVVTPLYAKLPAAEQAKAFEPAKPRTRKVILSTNVAETSVTIPGVRYVVDCGLAKEKRYHAGTGIESLMTENISQSSAKQRAGRAGRETDGHCFRLYTEASYHALERRTLPEIKRVSLTFALLHLLAAGQDDVFTFHYMDRPDKESIVFALVTLRGLEAVDAKGRITALGRQMAALPLDPVYARVLIASFAEGCPREIIDLVSLINSSDQLLPNAAATRDQATAARSKFIHRTGDHMMLLNILKAFDELDGKDERKVWCKDNFVSYKALRSVLEARKQLRERIERQKLGDWNQSAGDEAEPVLAALVGGLFANTALRQEDGTYRHTLTKQIVSIHPSSSMHNKKVPAIIYDELVLTTRTYARGVSSIPPTFIRQKAPSLFSS